MGSCTSQCFKLAAVHHNISSILSELDVGIYSTRGEWTDENKRLFYVNGKMVLSEHLILLLS